MNTKQFTGFLSSSANPGNLSLTVASFTKTLLSIAALYAVAKGLDTQTVTSQVQQVIDTVATGFTAALVVYHSLMTVYGLVHKALHALFAKPVVTVPVATPVAIATDGTAISSS
jgi:hypothetical protein